jgi:DNA-binding transcriptional ArsR family regulator
VPTTHRQSEAGLNEQFALVISCEITVKTMILIADDLRSPKEVGERLGISASKASHHLKKLERLGLAELVEEREVGGAIQHFYRAVIRPIVNDEEWDKLSVRERQLYSIWIVQLILADAAKSFDSGLFDVYSKRHLSRSPLLVDRQGLAEVAEIQNRAMYDSFEVVARSAERRIESGEEGINLLSAMMCFPLPGPSEGPKLRTETRASQE